MAAFYNEIDPAAAHVLRCLIEDGVIAPGVVDTRSIKDLTPDDLTGFTQAHFFAGGGLWSVAARLAGWPDDRPLWTGSCPCQPFSAAGKGGGGGGRPGAAGPASEADGGGLDVADADQPLGRLGDQQPAGQFAVDEQDAGAGIRPGSRDGSFWSDAEWLACHDGKARRTQPGLRLLVDGFPGRVGLWRVAGNAIVAPLAAEVIRAFMDVEAAA